MYRRNSTATATFIQSLASRLKRKRMKDSEREGAREGEKGASTALYTSYIILSLTFLSYDACFRPHLCDTCQVPISFSPYLRSVCALEDTLIYFTYMCVCCVCVYMINTLTRI